LVDSENSVWQLLFAHVVRRAQSSVSGAVRNDRAELVDQRCRGGALLESGPIALRFRRHDLSKVNVVAQAPWGTLGFRAS
jgi:hypothetical protein